MLEAIITVYRLGGPAGFFRGLQARVLYQMPATAICWSTYEFFKYILGATKIADTHTVSIMDKDFIKSDYVYQTTETITLKPSPAVSGAGLYGAISFNTMHKDTANINCTRRINDPILDITHT